MRRLEWRGGRVGGPWRPFWVVWEAGGGVMGTPWGETGKLRPGEVVPVACLPPSFRLAARAPGGERGAVITFRPLMSRPELAVPWGCRGGWEDGACRGGKGGREAVWWLLGQGW